ncbi:tetratricopeptide repeat-containing protein [Rhizobium sp. 2MFCol3.1]|uniref:ATP-grasp domain-containing protein n=1 Tax=Rhizobium sp. 2MFCol3.1 TaxID=1246459 RepID=UPI0003A39FBA|nr:tetratricopeptide repeat-containing protein [Rhizobium sp. 2MFCol3.1]
MKNAAARILEAEEEGHVIAGKAVIVRAIYEGKDVTPYWEMLMARVTDNLADAGAFMDLSIILQTHGKSEQAAIAQKGALETSRAYRIRNGKGTGLRVLVIVTHGDFMANTPIEFLLESSDVTILLHYVDETTADLNNIPEHDVAFVAVGESPDNLPVLENLERVLSAWKGPILNNAPRAIIDLSREGVSEAFRDEPTILAPLTSRIAREALRDLADGTRGLDTVDGLANYPIIVRPTGTHAGHGMEKIASADALAAYLGGRDETDFYIAPFIDYSSEDGKFRKQRVAVIDGKPYASHLAISDHWMVHYLSAGMAEHGERRLEEAAWMENFDADFAKRHASAFDALSRRLGLDYFAIDCAELSDGRLLLFEADVAMIVHAMDSESVFPYKKKAMNALFAAFESALAKRVATGSKLSTVSVVEPL